MKLKRFTVREFRSIWDSGPIEVDNQITCLVGKNESGKTALLTALYRTHPVVPEDAKFEATYDYPKQEVGDYLDAIEQEAREEVVVVECKWELEEDDKAVVMDVFGSHTLKEDCFSHKTYYGQNCFQFVLEVDERAAREHLAVNKCFSSELQTTLKSKDNWDDFAGALEEHDTEDENMEIELVNALRTCKNIVDQVIEDGLATYIFNELIWPRTPKFLYFDEYYQMTGRTNLNALIRRQQEKNLESSDRPLLGLINLAKLDPQRLVDSQSTTALKNKLEGAGYHLTKEIMKHWSQNKHIEIKFDVRDAKSEDPEGMRDGTNIWGEIHDTAHGAHTPLGSRSRGFIWFFSFLAWYEDIKRREENVVLLLDEPGLSLHGRAQADLLAYFEKELEQHQLIYSTHSPFMIDPQHFDRVRIVQDKGIDSDGPLPRDENGTKVLTNVLDATGDSLFPLQGALGYELHQTLFVGPNILLVECPSDLLYLMTVSSQLERQGRTGLSAKWTITPVGGSGKVPTFVALLHSQRNMKVATLLDIKASDRPMIEGLYKKKLLKKKHVMTYADFLDQEEADVEDMFGREFYIRLVNEEFKTQLTKPIKLSSLNKKMPRILQAIESFLNKNQLKQGAFNHYRPARYFTENINDLWEQIPDRKKDAFESIFQKTNVLIE